MSDHTHNLEIEASVLATVVHAQDPKKAWAIVGEHLQTPLAFYGRDHQLLALVIGAQWAAGADIDATSLLAALSQVSFADAMRQLSNVNNGATVTLDPFRSPDDPLSLVIGLTSDILVGVTPRASSPEALGRQAKIVADHYRQRQVIALLTKALEGLNAASARTKLGEIADGIFNGLAKVVSGRSGARSLHEHGYDAIKAHDRASEAGNRPLPVWPLPTLNDLCPFRGGAMVVLAGSPGSGKTSLALQVATESAKVLGGPCGVGIVSREMPGLDLARLVVSRHLGVPRSDIERGLLLGWQRAEALAYLDRIGHGQGVVIYDNLGPCTSRDICAWARQQVLRTGGSFRLLVIDHLQLLDGASPKASEYERISQATRELKCVALELDITVLLLSQLNRAAKNTGQAAKGFGRAGMEAGLGADDFELKDLRGSGTIEADADQVVFLCNLQPGAAQPNVRIKVAKNRWGALGCVECVFDKPNGQVYREKISPPGSNRMASEPSEAEDLFT